MTDEDAQDCLNAIRRVISRSGFATLDTEIFNGFQVDSTEREMPQTAKDSRWYLEQYLTRLDTYFKFFSIDRFERDLSLFNEQLVAATVKDVALELDPTMRSRFGVEAQSQSLMGLVKQFDATDVCSVISQIRERLIFGDNDDPSAEQSDPSTKPRI